MNVMNETHLVSRLITSPLPENVWISLLGGQTSLGTPYNKETIAFVFGWDNEFPDEPTDVSNFELQSHPVPIFT
jgi:hypothetical protein